MKKGKDNRSYPRAEIGFDVEIKVDEESEPVIVKANDVSATGISFESDIEMRNGHIFSMMILLNEVDRKIPAKAHAVRSWEKDGKKFISAQFMDIDYNDFIFLLDYSLVYVAPTA